MKTSFGHSAPRRLSADPRESLGSSTSSPRAPRLQAPRGMPWWHPPRAWYSTQHIWETQINCRMSRQMPPIQRKKVWDGPLRPRVSLSHRLDTVTGPTFRHPRNGALAICLCCLAEVADSRTASPFRSSRGRADLEGLVSAAPSLREDWLREAAASALCWKPRSWLLFLTPSPPLAYSSRWP